MARLLDWPTGVGIRSKKPLSGPRTVGATGRNESIGGRPQTVSSPFGAWKYELVLPVAIGRAYRRIEGLITALHGGANAVRVPFPVPDSLSWEESVVAPTSQQEQYGLPWSNGEGWSNGQNWELTPPNATIAAPASKDATRIQIEDEFWGHALDIGDEIGLFPFHFGKYAVTQRYGPGDYRIWPPLRKAVASGDFATLRPVLAMTLDNEQSADLARGVGYGEETTLIMSEVFDYDVRDYFTD